MIKRHKTTWLVLIFCALMGTVAAQAYDPAIEDYTAYPLFLTQAVQPNILLIVDSSWSMHFMAYGYHDDRSALPPFPNYHPDDFGAIAYGAAEGGDESSLVDNDATFTENVAVGDILHNIDDGSTGTITAVTDTTLTIGGRMSYGHTNANDGGDRLYDDSGDRYWVESQTLKDPTTVEEGYYGYFVPTAHYTYSSNVFVRDDDSGEWSGAFLNWLTTRRVDAVRKVLMGGLATSRTGTGNQHLIGEDSNDLVDFLKLPNNSDLASSRHTPYDNRHFYRIVRSKIQVFRLEDDHYFDFTKDFTDEVGQGSGEYEGRKGNNIWIMEDVTFTEDGQDYTITGLLGEPVNGTADSLADLPNDEDSIHHYFLYDPDKDFVVDEAVDQGDLFWNEANDMYARVGRVPATGDEIIEAFEDLYGETKGHQLLYDMFHFAGGSDGYVKCVKCTPDVHYRPCGGTSDFEQCQALKAAELNAALSDLATHLVLFDEPTDPVGQNHNEAYTIYADTEGQATKVATFQVEVDRNATDPDEDRDFLDGNLAGLIQKVGDKARFGLEFFNSDDEGGEVVQYVGSGITDLINRIQNHTPDAGTPLAESLYEGVRYYQQAAPYYSNGDFTRNNTWDPFYFNDLHRFVECSKSFILQITDGEPTRDLNIPETVGDYDGDGNDPGTRYHMEGSDYTDDVALYAHTKDLRSDLDGEQSLYYYTVFAFGKGMTLLQDAARNGAFEDANGDGLPEPPDGDDALRILEWDRDDDGVPDAYFEAANGFELERQIHRAILDILETAASGTAVALPSAAGREEGMAYQAFFKPKTSDTVEEVKFIGYLQPLWVDEQGNLREDTVADARLVPKEDKIIRFRFDQSSKQTFVDRYADDDGDYEPDASDPDSTVLLENLQAVWEAGKKLALTDPDQRRIFTFADAADDWDGVCDACSEIPSDTDFSIGETKAFTLTNLNEFKAFLDVLGEDTDAYNYLGEYTGSDSATVDLRAENLVRFTRGEQLDGMRNREVTVDGAARVWKLGDIVYSTPTVLSPPADAYDKIYGDRDYLDFAKHWKDRDAMVLVGANDGMLHAFRAGRFVAGDDEDTDNKYEASYILDPSAGDLGSEAWAYIPFNLLPHLKWLADPLYTHVYYVDHKIKVADVQIFDDAEDDHPHGWGTLLVGGLRLGGGPYPSGITLDSEEMYFRSAYFLMDVTDPESPEVLAEFTHPNLGFTTSYPAFTKVDDNWYVILGSGPTPGTSPPFNYGATSDQVARLFVIDLTVFMTSRQIREGIELFIFEGTQDDAFMADPISVDKPLDYSVDVVYVGETYWASNRWNGLMRRLKTNGSTNPADWELSTLLETGQHQAITAPASASMGFNDDLWVFFGTGRFYNALDKADTHTQNLYGVHDTCMDSGGSCTTLDPGDLYDVTDFTVDAGGATAFNELADPFKAGDRVGWKLDLEDAGERCLNKPVIIGGAVLISTFTPDSDICAMSGDGKLYGLYFQTGTAHYKPIIGENETTGESIRSRDIGKGMPASLGIHVGKQTGGTGFVQSSTGAIIEQDIEPPLQFKSGGISWRQF